MPYQHTITPIRGYNSVDMERKPINIPTESSPGAMHTSRHNEFELDVYKLIRLTQELPETDVALGEYESEFDHSCWTDTNGGSITPRTVIDMYKNKNLDEAITAHPELAEHLQQISRADYSHPILIFESKVIDGVHRLAKAYAEGQTSIKARIITQIPQGAVIKLHPKE